MNEPDFTRDTLCATHVAIWGLGLMGGSLALALRGKCASLVGIDMDPSTLKQARERDIVDRALTVAEVRAHPETALAGMDLIILAVPVRAILALLEELPDLCPGPAVIMDMGSTKAKVGQAMERLPERFEPVGGHPMCGKEKSSLQYAEAGLFKDAPFFLVQQRNTTTRAREMAEMLAQAVEARPMWLPADAHDRWVAATSHLPFLTACALSQATPTAAAALVGPGFRSATRLAGSSNQMMVDIMATNQDSIRAAIDAFIAQMTELKAMLEQDDFEGLSTRFKSGAEQHERLTGGLNPPRDH